MSQEDNDNERPHHDEAGKFKEGNNANPKGGRPTPHFHKWRRDMQKALRKEVTTSSIKSVLDTLLQVATDPNNPRCIEAAKEYLNRSLGKVSASLQIDVKPRQDPADLIAFLTQALGEEAMKIRSQREGRGTYSLPGPQDEETRPPILSSEWNVPQQDTEGEEV